MMGEGEGTGTETTKWALPACLHHVSVVEWTTTRRRAVTVTVLGCSYSLGQMALGALAFTLRDWRALQTAVSMPFFAVFLISWLVQCETFALGEDVTH